MSGALPGRVTLDGGDSGIATWLQGAVDTLGAVGAVIVEVDPDRRVLAPRWWVGYRREVVESWQAIPLDLSTPLTDAAREARVVSITSAQFAQRFREMTKRPLVEATGYAVAPLTDAAGAVWGALGLSFTDDQEVLRAVDALPHLADALQRRRTGQDQAGPTQGDPLGSWSVLDWNLFGSAADMLLSSAPVGFALLDGDLRYVRVNQQLAELNGRPAADHVGRTVREVVPQLAPAAEPIFREVLATGVPAQEINLSGEVPGAPGAVRHWLESVHRVLTPDGEAGLAVVVWDVTARAEAEQARAHTLALLDLLIMNAPIGIAFLDRQLRYLRINESLAAANGLPVADHIGRSVADVLPEVAPTVVPLLRRVLETGEPVIGLQLETGETPAQPGRARYWRISFYPVRPVDGGEPPEGLGLIVTDVTERVAADRERARLDAEAAAARHDADLAHQRLALLAKVSDVLSGSLNEQDVMHQLAQLLVPARADWLVVLLADSRGRLVPRYSCHADPEHAHLAPEVMRVGALPVTGPTTPARVFREQRAVAARDVTAYLREQGMPADLTEVGLRLDPGVGLLLPMVVRGRSIGVLWLMHDAGRPDDLTAEVELFSQVARRFAVALDNARLFGQHSRIASRLQEDLLPARLPSIPGVQLAVRYSTAEEAVEVGGDLYDVVPRHEPGSWLLTIGDVSGRGVDAAGITGLARHTLGALADVSPAEALERLNRIMISRRVDERFLTAAVAHLTLAGPGAPPGARLHLARAGHPAPLLLRADGTTQVLGPAGSLLGVGPDLGLETLDVTLVPGDTLLFYTDGVTETPGRDGLFGEERLAAAARESLTTALGDHQAPVADRVADEILAALDGYRTAPADDDLALLVVHVHTPASRELTAP